MRTILLAAVLAVLPTVALADTSPPDVAKMQTDDCARARKAHKTCEITIGEETIEGNGVTASGTVINPRTFAVLNSLIHIRKDFIPEIIKAAEDVD